MPTPAEIALLKSRMERIAGAPRWPADELDTNRLDEGTIRQESWIGGQPGIRAIFEGAKEMLGVAPSARIMDRLFQARSPLLRPQSAFGWADWGAGLLADTAQTGLAAADVGALAPIAGRHMARTLGNEIGTIGKIDKPPVAGVKTGKTVGGGAVEKFDKNLTPEQRVERLSDRQKREAYERYLESSHNDELFYDQYPTWGKTDKEVNSITADMVREHIEQYNKAKSQFDKDGFIDDGFFQYSPDESIEHLKQLKNNMQKAADAANVVKSQHEKTKALFYNNGKWSRTSRESGGVTEDLLEKLKKF